MSYYEKSKELYKDQLRDWSLFADNRAGLENAKLKVFNFDGFDINVQYNPKRITSSAAKVDAKSIAERKCFLCAANRPDVQTEVNWENRFEILVNPFPIFKEHFTISSNLHEDQSVEVEFENMLKLTRDLKDQVLFYNAPKCGASAPDHLHFQSGNMGFLPIEKDWESIKSKYTVSQKQSGDLSLYAIDDKLRKYLVLESSDIASLNKEFQLIHSFAKDLENGEAPMLNILTYLDGSIYRVFVFVREKHRPWQFFEEGEKNIMLSPASVDMGGTLITPLEKDFEKLTKEDIQDIFNQISLSEENFKRLNLYLELNER